MIKFCALSLFILGEGLFSQTDSIYNFTLPQLKITQLEKGKTVTYDFDNNINSFTLTDSFLIANPNKYKYKVNINAVKKISFKRSSIKTWIIATGVTGFILGFLASGFSFHGESKVTFVERIGYGIIAGGFLAIFGGILGAITSKNDDYPIDKTTLSKKRLLLLEALTENKFK